MCNTFGEQVSDSYYKCATLKKLRKVNGIKYKNSGRFIHRLSINTSHCLPLQKKKIIMIIRGKLMYHCEYFLIHAWKQIEKDHATKGMQLISVTDK